MDFSDNSAGRRDPCLEAQIEQSRARLDAIRAYRARAPTGAPREMSTSEMTAEKNKINEMQTMDEKEDHALLIEIDGIMQALKHLTDSLVSMRDRAVALRNRRVISCGKSQAFQHKMIEAMGAYASDSDEVKSRISQLEAVAAGQTQLADEYAGLLESHGVIV